MNSEKMARHAKAFGDAHTKTMALNIQIYDESQCRECPHEFTCCDFLVACAPFEALGIIHYLKVTHGAEGLRGLLGLIKWRAKDIEAHIKEYLDENGAIDDEANTRMADDWYAKRNKCVFYNGKNRNCSIYEVRPIACRRAFGDGDCTKGGVSVAVSHEYAEIRRLTRIKITQGPPLEQHREMTSLISYLADGAQIGMAKGEQELLDKEPLMLTDEDQIWGPDGPPLQLNPIEQGV